MQAEVDKIFCRTSLHSYVMVSYLNLFLHLFSDVFIFVLPPDYMFSYRTSTVGHKANESSGV